MTPPLRPRYRRIRREVEALLNRAEVSSPPVPVKKIAGLLGVRIVLHDFENKVSGLVFRDGESIIIGVAKEHSSKRQRFTIAHELGHIVLHNIGELHVDNSFTFHFRSEASSLGEDVQEIESNAFAAELLMPESFLREHTKGLIIDMEDDAQIVRLAALYEVSVQAMTYRLLNVLDPRNMVR
jgi:Zn-dependent peptidase ImmA (M78 family)